MTNEQSWKLTIVEGSGSGQSFNLGREVSIGREANNTIILNEPKASRNHAVIRQQGNIFVLLDQGSSNGTYINGSLVTQPMQIQNGDRITIGDTQFAIHDRHSAAPVGGAPATMLYQAPQVTAAHSGSPAPVTASMPRQGTPTWIWIAGVGAIVVVVLLAVALIGGAGFLAGRNTDEPPETQVVALVQPSMTTEVEAAQAPTEIPDAGESAAAANENPPQPIEPTATLEPLPTATPEPLPTNTPPPPPTAEPSTPEANITSMMQDANILLFEDIAGAFLNRYVKQALDNSGYQYTDVSDRVGDLKSEMLSGKPWDLIIVAVEARSAVQGEFFDYINTHLTNGAGVIIEIWNLDKIGGGRASQILGRCGVTVQGDWNNPPSRSVMWLVPEHPVFHEPNEGISLVNYSPYWVGDAGDLLRKTSGSNATMLGGTIASEKDRYGTLVSCMDGRLIIQTHSTHDYRAELMVPLWQNYIDYTLRSHFEALP